MTCRRIGPDELVPPDAHHFPDPAGCPDCDTPGCCARQKTCTCDILLEDGTSLAYNYDCTPGNAAACTASTGIWNNPHNGTCLANVGGSLVPIPYPCADGGVPGIECIQKWGCELDCESTTKKNCVSRPDNNPENPGWLAQPTFTPGGTCTYGPDKCCPPEYVYMGEGQPTCCEPGQCQCGYPGNYASLVDWSLWKIRINGRDQETTSTPTDCTPVSDPGTNPDWNPGTHVDIIKNIGYDQPSCSGGTVYMYTYETYQVGPIPQTFTNNASPLLKYCSYKVTITADSSLTPRVLNILDASTVECVADETLDMRWEQCCGETGGKNCSAPTVEFIPA